MYPLRRDWRRSTSFLLILCSLLCHISCYYIDSKNNIGSAYALVDATDNLYIWGSITYTQTNTKVTEIASTRNTFVVLKPDGNIQGFGNISSPAINNVAHIFANPRAYVAQLSDLFIICWGDTSAGGDCSSITNSAITVIAVYATAEAFAARTTSNSVVTWGNSGYGGDSSNVSSYLNSNTFEIFSTDSAFAARLYSGYVVCWGNYNRGGYCPNLVLSSEISNIYSTVGAFAVLTTNSQVITWGDAAFGGSSSNITHLSVGVQFMISGATDFIAYTTDSKLVSWGGQGTIIRTPSNPINRLYSNFGAFVALDTSGNPTVWGSSPYGGEYSTSSTFTWVYANKYAFVGVMSDNKIRCWGSPSYGGSCSEHWNIQVKRIAAIEAGFIAITCDGSVVSWGQFANTLPNTIIKPMITGSNHRYSRSSDVVDDTINACEYPSDQPTRSPTSSPTPLNIFSPTTPYPTTSSPFASPFASPSSSTFTTQPTTYPTFLPTLFPTAKPSSTPTRNPIYKPTADPTYIPSVNPTYTPSVNPTTNPTCIPSVNPTFAPSSNPTIKPTSAPSVTPTFHPTSQPTLQPSEFPTGMPSGVPTSEPTATPSSQPTSVPSSVPTSIPTCPKLYTHEDGTTSCVCKAGYYTQFDNPDSISVSWSSLNTTCRQCPSNYFSTEDGTEICTQCSWPETTRFDGGNTECKGYCLCFSQTQLLKVVPPVLFVFILCIALANESKYALGIVLFFPTLDVLSDVLYLATTLYYARFLCFLSVVFLLAPSLIWIYELKSKEAYPTFLVWPFPEIPADDGNRKFYHFMKPNYTTDLIVITLSFQSSTPLHRGIPIKPFFKNHDGIPHVLSFVALWIGSIVYQLFIIFLFLVWLGISLIFQFFWFFLGIFLHLTKLFSIGKVQTFWLYLWTGSNKHECDRDVDIGTLNRDMLAEFLLESLPQLLVQSINNQLTKKWTLIGWISAGLSMFVALNGTYRMMYWMLWKKVPIDQVQMGMALKILGAKPDLRHPSQFKEENSKHPDLEKNESAVSSSGKLSFRDAKIAPSDNPSQSRKSDVIPFTSVKSGISLELASPHPNTTQEPPFQRQLTEENEIVWRDNIWELLNNPENSLDTNLTKQKMTNVGLGSAAEIRYMNETDLESIGSTLKAVPRRKLRFLWGGRLVKTHAYLPVSNSQIIGDSGPNEGNYDLAQVIELEAGEGT